MHDAVIRAIERARFSRRSLSDHWLDVEFVHAMLTDLYRMRQGYPFPRPDWSFDRYLGNELTGDEWEEQLEFALALLDSNGSMVRRARMVKCAGLYGEWGT